MVAQSGYTSGVISSFFLLSKNIKNKLLLKSRQLQLVIRAQWAEFHITEKGDTTEAGPNIAMCIP